MKTWLIKVQKANQDPGYKQKSEQNMAIFYDKNFDILVRPSFMQFVLILCVSLYTACNGNIEIQPTQIIPGGRIDTSASVGIYGNNVMARTDIPDVGRQQWLDFGSPLVGGTLLKYYLYTLYSSGQSLSSIKLQIWRPQGDDDQYKLIWQRLTKVNMSASVMGSLYVFDLAEQDTILTQSGDLLGWFSDNVLFPVSRDTINSPKCYYRRVEDDDFAVPGSIYSFETLGFPYKFSAAVEIGTGEDDTPTVVSISPLNGPLAGQTLVTVMGREFTAVNQVVLGEKEHINLEIINRKGNNYFVVKTPEADMTIQDKPLNIIITLAGGDAMNTRYEFTYRANPRINDIYPLKTIPEGGTTLTFVGSSMDAVARPMLDTTLVLTNGGMLDKTDMYYEEMCTPHNFTTLLCPTPTLSTRAQTMLEDTMTQDTQLGAALYIGLRLDGVKAYRNISANKDLINKGVLGVYAAPVFTDTHTIYVFEEDVLLNIKGSNLRTAVAESDYHIDISDGGCSIKDISDSVIHCLPPQLEPEKPSTGDYKHHEIVVQIGRFVRYNVGQLDYRKFSVVKIAVPVVIAVVVIVVVVIILVVIYKKRSKQKQSKQIELKFDKINRTDDEKKSIYIHFPPVRQESE